MKDFLNTPNPLFLLIRVATNLGKFWYLKVGSQKLLGWVFLVCAEIAFLINLLLGMGTPFTSLVSMIVLGLFGLAIAILHPENEESEGDTIQVSFPFDKLRPLSEGYLRENLLFTMVVLYSVIAVVYVPGALVFVRGLGVLTTAGCLTLASFAATLLYMNVSGGAKDRIVDKVVGGLRRRQRAGATS